ncbi:TetR/AcrR family transcriptional regulator [Marinovum sp.]|uniref:TetR/AcrR family transcriptional regulator n=1 Tax=Marinovum sp. TaxID=2024839 RepID=UPI002B26FF20|nr:TetR family transcriptional regulator [Marinovum sp.]
MKRKRAEEEAQTRARIAQAAVDLHGSIGPARTTISAVAERAGVRRATVYRHFPDEVALFSACSSRWLAQNPLPDVSQLSALEDESRRLEAALTAVYGYYRPNVRMLSNVIRDAETSPALRETLAGFQAWLADLHAALAPAPGPPLRGAALAHALSFPAWHALAIGQGLSDAEARVLMCAMVAAVPG